MVSSRMVICLSLDDTITKSGLSGVTRICDGIVDGGESSYRYPSRSA